MNWSIEDERVVPREELFMPKLKKLLQQPLNWSKVDEENFNCKNPECWLVLTQKRCCKLSKLYKAGHKNQWLGAGRSQLWWFQPILWGLLRLLLFDLKWLLLKRFLQKKFTYMIYMLKHS